jgi:polyhydroxyalkanoate synthesis regulator phasin
MEASEMMSPKKPRYTIDEAERDVQGLRDELTAEQDKHHEHGAWQEEFERRYEILLSKLTQAKRRIEILESMVLNIDMLNEVLKKLPETAKRYEAQNHNID